MQDDTVKMNSEQPQTPAVQAAAAPDLPVISAEPPAEGDPNALPAEFLERRKKAKRKRMLKIGAAVAVVACIGIGLAAYFLSSNNDAAEQTGGTGTYTEQVTVGDLDLTVEGSGSLSAKSTSSVIPSVNGTVKKIYVSEGDEVEEGDTLFTMTSDDLDDAVEEAADALGQAAESLDDAEEAYEDAKDAASSSSSSNSSSSSSSSNSSSSSSKKSGSSSSSNKSSSSSSSSSKSGSGSSASSGASSNSGSSTSSSSSTDSSDSSLAAQSATTTQASYSLSSASTTTVSTSTGASSDAVSQAKSALQQAQSNYKQAYKAYQKAVAALDDLTVKAESDGTVTAINISVGDTVGSGGSSASGNSDSSSAAMTISDYSKMSITMQVSEYDISNIEKGQKATVTVTALDKTCKAKVTSVSATASTSSSSGNSSSSTAYYDVVLTISKPTDDMKEGMSATVELAYESFEDALLVSTGAISTSPDGTSYVTVQNGEQTTQVQVEVLGGTDDTSAVTGELNEGDTVVVTYQISSSDNAANSSSGNTDMGHMMGEMSGNSNGGNGGQRGNSGGGPGGEMPSGGGPGGNN